MLDYLINLLEDATDFSWASAKASHAVLLCRMEQGEIKGWAETKKTDRVRRAHAQRHVSTAHGNTRNTVMGRLCPVSTLTKAHVCKSSHMKPGEFFTSMSVLTVGKKKPNLSPIVRRNVKKMASKTNKMGHAQQRVCPQI